MDDGAEGALRAFVLSTTRTMDRLACGPPRNDRAPDQCEPVDTRHVLPSFSRRHITSKFREEDQGSGRCRSGAIAAEFGR